eukprot:TRINITY_DN11768_c0_g1_i1.p1 TRINITY_DN11768_c0_g1~~TRINITY_DN11768_c0_g1_i1.p1  ORF type:complete len:299 (-),score=51.84 TRINITY_DN11768_c0_g1_i1:56-952(-)
MAFYKDLGKLANDLLNKGWASNEKYSWKVESNLNSNGVSVTPTIQSDNNKETLDGSIKASFPLLKLQDFNLNFTGTANLNQSLKLEFTTSKALNDVYKPTLEVNTTVNTPVQSSKAKFSTEIKQSWGGATISWTGPGDHVFNASVLTFKALENGSVAVGSEIEYSRKSPLKINLASSYFAPALITTVFGKFKVGKPNDTILGLNVYNRVNSSFNVDTQVGGEVQYDLSGKDTQLTIGANTKLDLNSTLKGRVTSKGIVGFAFNQRFNAPVDLTFLVDVDLTGLNKPRAIQYGVKLNLY